MWCKRCNTLEARMKISIHKGKGEAFSYFTFSDDDVRACLELDSKQDVKLIAESAYREALPELLFAISLVRSAALAGLEAGRPLEPDEIHRLVAAVFHQSEPLIEQPRVPIDRNAKRNLNSLEKLVIHASLKPEERRYINVPCNCCGKSFLEICRFHNCSSGISFPIKGQMHVLTTYGNERALCGQCEQGSSYELAKDYNKSRQVDCLPALRPADIKPWLLLKDPRADVSEAVLVASCVVALCGQSILFSQLHEKRITLQARQVGDSKVEPWAWLDRLRDGIGNLRCSDLDAMMK